ncbi:hypothetical protein [Streptomyces sp. NPDC047043]|uniref:hypothetical protein n=1 Tax=Streptomyces sp. NPDC047043 TaxID=3154497 RepID=UPI0033FB5265
MAMNTESLSPWPIARQLRRMRAMYAAGVALWAASSAWTGWADPGSRPMWTSLLLLVVFTGLVVMTSWSLRRLESADAMRRLPNPRSGGAASRDTRAREFRQSGGSLAEPYGRFSD